MERRIALDLFRGRIVVYPFLEIDQARVDAGNAQAATVIRAERHDADLRVDNSVSSFYIWYTYIYTYI